MQIKSVQKYVRMSPRKLRLVVPLLKNLSPVDALEVLPQISKVAVEPLGKVIRSAIASAKEKKISERELIFKEIQINEGPRLKRYRAGARGRAKTYQRKMSHIRVVLTTKSEALSSKSKTDTNDQISKSKTKKAPKKSEFKGRGK